jgi:hypothetical protein
METYDGETRMSDYKFSHVYEDKNLSYSFSVHDETTPTEIYEQFCHFLTAVYGWDVRKHLNENITS